jgi:hypothetical protein
MSDPALLDLVFSINSGLHKLIPQIDSSQSDADPAPTKKRFLLPSSPSKNGAEKIVSSQDMFKELMKGSKKRKH